MKKLRYFIFIALLLCSFGVFAQTTTIWLVRHAEKEVTGGSDSDLSPAGRSRADELAKKLNNQHIAAVFTTPYKRTSQTGEPTLKQAGLTSVQTYSPADLVGLVKQVLKDHSGQNILIVGHSNTIIPTLQAFGVAKPFDTLTDDDYDLLFNVTIGPDGKAVLEISYYGDKHHTTVIPKVN